jgi:hypothetical protein
VCWTRDVRWIATHVLPDYYQTTPQLEIMNPSRPQHWFPDTSMSMVGVTDKKGKAVVSTSTITLRERSR